MLFAYICIKSFIYLFNREQTPPTTPERVRSEAQQTERDQRVLDSPDRHRTPHHVRLARSGISIHPPAFMPPTAVPPRPPLYQNLPPHLAQQYAALPDLYPSRGVSAAPQLAPAFVPAPAPALPRFPNLPADLAERVAAAPQLAPAF